MFSAEQQSSSNSVSRRAVLLHPKVVSQGEQLTPKPSSSVPVLRCMLFFCLLATNYLAQQHRVGEEQSRLIGSTKKNAITLFFTLPIKCGQTTFAGAAARPLLQSLHLYQPLRKGKVTSLDQARENDMKTKLCIVHTFTFLVIEVSIKFYVIMIKFRTLARCRLSNTINKERAQCCEMYCQQTTFLSIQRVKVKIKALI